MFDALADEALRAYDRIVGLDLTEAAVHGSIHKAPCGGDGTGKSPVDRGKSGWKWSLLTDRNGIPVSWAADGANRNDITLFEPTVAAAGGLLADVETLHLDRGYDYGAVRACAANHGIDDVVCAKRRKPGAAATKTTVPAGTALGHRAHQLVAVELRAATPQTPTAGHDTDSPNSPSRSRCFSPPNSSTGETAGAPNDRLPAHALSRVSPRIGSVLCPMGCVVLPVRLWCGVRRRRP